MNREPIRNRAVIAIAARQISLSPATHACFREGSFLFGRVY